MSWVAKYFLSTFTLVRLSYISSIWNENVVQFKFNKYVFFQVETVLNDKANNSKVYERDQCNKSCKKQNP